MARLGMASRGAARPGMVWRSVARQDEGIFLMNTTKAIPELSVDTQTIERILLAADVGTVIEYTVLSAAIGRNVQTDARHIMESARRRVLKSHRMVFEPVIDVGLKRLDDAGIVSLGPAYTGRIHNMARRGAQKLTAVQHFDELPNELKLEHNVRLAQLGAVRHMSGSRAAKNLSGRIKETVRDLPLRQCLDAMKEII